jgi:hypothetical protein
MTLCNKHVTLVFIYKIVNIARKSLLRAINYRRSEKPSRNLIISLSSPQNAVQFPVIVKDFFDVTFAQLEAHQKAASLSLADL